MATLGITWLQGGQYDGVLKAAGAFELIADSSSLLAPLVRGKEYRVTTYLPASSELKTWDVYDDFTVKPNGHPGHSAKGNLYWNRTGAALPFVQGGALVTTGNGYASQRCPFVPRAIAAEMAFLGGTTNGSSVLLAAGAQDYFSTSQPMVHVTMNRSTTGCYVYKGDGTYAYVAGPSLGSQLPVDGTKQVWAVWRLPDDQVVIHLPDGTAGLVTNPGASARWGTLFTIQSYWSGLASDPQPVHYQVAALA